MNHRRDLILLLGAATAAPRMLRAQSKQTPERTGKPVRVGMFSETTPAKAQYGDKQFIDAMRALGWVEGRNVVYDGAYADDDLTRLPAVATALVARQPDVIHVRNTQATMALTAQTRSIPIVFTGVSDPDQRGIVKALARPGGNVTGVTPIGAELGGKRLQLLKQALPKVSRVGVLVNPTYSPVSSKDFKAVQEVASRLGVTTIPAMVNSAAEIDAAFALFAKSRAEAVLLTQNAVLSREGGRILQLAAAQRLPVVSTGGSIADQGGFMGYGAVASEQYARAALIVDKILKGAKPADIPVEQPTRFELVINLKTARAFGITIPQAFLVTADRVIE
jgi:putative ABC transport system substrate-binding protein